MSIVTSGQLMGLTLRVSVTVVTVRRQESVLLQSGGRRQESCVVSARASTHSTQPSSPAPIQCTPSWLSSSSLEFLFQRLVPRDYKALARSTQRLKLSSNHFFMNFQQTLFITSYSLILFYFQINYQHNPQEILLSIIPLIVSIFVLILGMNFPTYQHSSLN